jgi:hypothetical protein
VLAIGVGVYDHLMGGSKTLLDNPFGLGQLGSPPVSAKRFTEWVLADLKNPAAELAGVEVLISSADPTTIEVPGEGAKPVAAATMENIKRAFNEWYARVNTDDQNVAVLYHCGHGLESSDLALLAQDFGAPGGDPPQLWENAYNFHRTHLGMRRCVADAQFFFVDACRQVSADLLEFDGDDVRALIAPKLRRTNKDRNAPILYASARDSKAFAKTDEVSRFTQAVLDAMSGSGATKAGGTWKVSNESLPAAVMKRIKRGNKLDVPLQIPKTEGESTTTSVIHELDGPPLIPTYVASAAGRPFPQTTRLEFRLGRAVSAQSRGPGPWELDVTAGIYDVRAMNDGALMGTDTDGWVMPPEYEGTVQ